MEDFHKKAGEEMAKKKAGKEHQQLVAQMTFMRTFPFRADSMLRRYLKRRTPGRPVWLQPSVAPDSLETIELLGDVKPILKHHIMIVPLEELTRRDWEWHLARRFSRRLSRPENRVGANKSKMFGTVLRGTRKPHT